MLALFAVGVAAVLIVALAVRFVLGWILPRSAIAAIGRVIDAVMMTAFKLIVIALAGVIVWAVWTAFAHGASQGSYDPRVIW